MPEEPEAGGFRRATPVLKTGDYPAARAFYTAVLGFRVAEEGGSPPRFGILERERAVVFLDGWNGPPPPSEGWASYFHVADADAACRAFQATGAVIARPPRDTVYGMRAFELEDPDGNRLCFGAAAPGTASPQQ